MDEDAARARILAEKQDEESLDRLIEDIASESASKLKPIPSAGHTLQVELLMQILDYLQVMNSTTIAMKLPKGKKPPKVHPRPRPRSMYEVLKKEDEAMEVEETLFSGPSVSQGELDQIRDTDSTFLL